MDWFERLTGFREGDYRETRSNLEVVGNRLRSRVNGTDYGIGTLEVLSLRELRERTAAQGLPPPGQLRLSIVDEDVRALHRAPENAGALFQVASQFNLLEMASETVTPEQGVTRYQYDPTQGPACAIAAGAATVYRNYFAPVAGGSGQTAERQIDCLAEMGAALSVRVGLPQKDLWIMRNGYALCTRNGLAAIARYLRQAPEDERDCIRRLLHIGLHRDVEVTDVADPGRRVVTQAFCSALPVGYCHWIPRRDGNWQPFAQLVLEGAYEATLFAAAANARRGASDTVFLTLLGGGAFGNDEPWILDAMRRALSLTRLLALDVRIVCYRGPSPAMRAMVQEFGR